MTTAGVLLAAGRSRRFGAEDKLLAPLKGRPLVAHAVAALRAVKPEVLIGVTRSAAVSRLLAGFEIVAPLEDAPEQADSLRAGLSCAWACGAKRVLVVLGDMPFVTPALLADVLARCEETRPSAATDGFRPMPPACFPEAFFPEVLALRGDRGAARLLRNLPCEALVHVPPRTLHDIDTVAGLATARAAMIGSEA
ncbi:MAG: nucleotidyltransferase family protein [Pseudomonadota bacterium]